MQNAVSYEGHLAITGQDTGTKASLLERSVLALAVNRTFRYGRNKTRPPFREISLSFANAEEEDYFRSQNAQGGHLYKKVRSQRNDGLLVAVGGILHFIRLEGTTGIVTRINDGLEMSSDAEKFYFCQLEEWVYVQDGVSKPLFWNGLATPTFSGWPDQKQMPTGTIMAAAHGRVFVANQFNQIVASDIIYGNGFTRTDNPQNFTETEYWQEGGTFGVVTGLGRITGMAVSSVINRTVNGDGELQVFCENGAMRLNVAIPRITWKDSNIQTVSLRGVGCASDRSLVLINNDIWFKSHDGWQTLINTSYGFDNRVSVKMLSKEANRWLQSETASLRKFASHIYFDRRLLGSTSPVSIVSDNVRHNYSEGILSLDLAEATTVIQGGQWDGLWTGIRPTVMLEGIVDGAKRGFAMSYDKDGVNRLYELGSEDGFDEADGAVRKQQWFYITKSFSWVEPQTSGPYLTKRLADAQIFADEIMGSGSVGYQFKPAREPYWFTGGEPQDVGVNVGGEFAGYGYSEVFFPSPDDQCGRLDNNTASGRQFQFRVFGEGVMEIDSARFGFRQPNEEADVTTTCDKNLVVESGDNMIAGLGDFDYTIIT
ncbi:MAG: hypothetical protein JW388_0957 [Nitrospira sp.]|nr:hypothetical protein [Nitrospira sp.]